jgi:VTC domain
MSPSTDSRENREFASEIKFLISPALAEQIRSWARACLSPDPYAGGEAGDSYLITSLYFDTPQFDMFHRRGSFGRSKYRIRRYNEGQVAFLERKLKTNGLLTKRRSIVELDELEQLSEDNAARDWAGYWFHRRLAARELKPVCQIAYRRTARVAMTQHGPIRLTLDDNLGALPAAGLGFTEGQGMLLLRDQIILEMKFRSTMPALFKSLIEEFALIPKPFSKYRRAATALELMNAPGAEVQQETITEYA